MNNNFIYTANNLLIAILFPLILFSFKNLLIPFALLEILFLALMQDKIFTFLKFIFFTSFVALFIIHNLATITHGLNWDFVYLYWIRILYLFLFISWLVLNISLGNLLTFLRDLGLSKETVFLITTTLIILRRIPVRLGQIYEVQKARGVLGNGIIERFVTYPKLIVPLITTLFREIDYFIINYYLLDEYSQNKVTIKYKFMTSKVITVILILTAGVFIGINIWYI